MEDIEPPVIEKPDSLPADVRQRMQEDLIIWVCDRDEVKAPKRWAPQRTLLSKALYLTGKLAAIPLSLIPGTAQFNEHWFGLARASEQKRYMGIVGRARKAYEAVLAGCEEKDRVTLLNSLRSIPEPYRAMIGA